MKIYFIRHGKSEYDKGQHNNDSRVPGQMDIPLTEEGKQEAKKTALQLPNDLSLIYSSDLIRCKHTAEILNENLKLPIFYDARLRERNFGSLEGKRTVKKIKSNFTIVKFYVRMELL